MRAFPFIAAAALAASVAAPAVAQEQTERREVRIAQALIEGTTLHIAAEGLVEGRPDMATVSLGVVTQGQTAAAALTANAQRMNALMAAVRRAGVAERDVQTANVSVNPQYIYQENQAPRISGYQAQNTVNVRVRNLDNLGRVIDSTVTAGGNTVNGISFGYQNPDAPLDAARRDAMAEARRLATLYAEAAGLRVGRMLSISEGVSMPPPMPFERVMVTGARDMAAATPIAPGEIETRVTVSVVYQLQ